MELDNDWGPDRDPRGMIFQGGTGALSMALLFASAAVGLALLAAPLAEHEVQLAIGSDAVGLDNTTTGSISQSDVYIIHRSVLQPTPNSVCIIHRDGLKTGDC